MSDELLDELRLIGCHANGDARCTCVIGQDAIARIEALTAERDALQSAIAAALERLDASLFTNAEHQQAKDILRNARKATP